MCDSGECPSEKCPLGEMFVRGNIIQKTFRQGKVRWENVRRTVQIPFLRLTFCISSYKSEDVWDSLRLQA